MNTKLSIFLSLFIYASMPAHAQEIRDLKLDNKISILNDKAYFLFPTDAKNLAREADIMSADYNINNETRVMLDIDKMRLVFFAQELYVFADKDPLAEILKDKDFSSKILTNKDSIVTILSTPLHFDSTQTAIMVNSLAVKTADNTVFRIGAYINPDAYKNRNDFIALSEKVFAGIIKGTRKLQLEARTETFPILDSKKELELHLPKNYLVTKDAKYDFLVLRLRKVVLMSDTNHVDLTIYEGDYPSYFYKDYRFEEANAEKVSGHFLERHLSWLYFKDSEKRIYLKEQQIPFDDIAERLIIHIAMIGSNEAAIDELTGVVEKIKLIGK